MLLKAQTPIGIHETAVDLHDRLAQMAGPLLEKTLCALVFEGLQGLPQDAQLASHAPKQSKHNAWIDWHQPAVVVHNKVRGQQPWPGAQSVLKDGDQTLVKILETALIDVGMPVGTNHMPGELSLQSNQQVWIETGAGPLRVCRVQPAGKKPMSAWDWLNGLGQSSKRLASEQPFCLLSGEPEASV
jgi:methionyl-tRNA formyltransferase